MTPRAPVGYRVNNGNFHNMVILSLIIHLVVITIIFVSVPTASRHLTFGTAYSVQLVGADAVLSSGGSSLLQDAVKSAKAADAVIIKRKIQSIYSAPEKSRETSSRVNIEKALSAIRQKGNAEEAAPAAGGPKVSDNDIAALSNEYIGVVWSRVRQNWAMPQSLLPEKNITAIVDVRISRSGSLEYAGFEKRSGNRYFDDSALRAVKKSSPFPPLPYWVRDKNIEIGIRFHSAELR